MHRRLLLCLMISGLSLSACATMPANNQVVNPGPIQTQAGAPVLGSALLKRPLMLQRIAGQVVPVAAVLSPTQGFSLKQLGDGAAPTSATIAPAPDMVSVARPAIAPMYYYGGSDFNQYVIQYAEESVHKAATGSTLLQVYNQDVKSLLGEWDASARLLESRAQVNGTEDEYIYLPGKDNEPLKLQPLYVFRFASTPKKETLNIYVLKDAIRVHRMVWGEPVIDIAKVQIDSDKAVEIARKAFANQDPKPGYPVYPDGSDVNAQVIKDIPSDVRWNLQLNQQSKDNLRYYVNFSFTKQVQGANPNYPVPKPEPMAVDTQVTSSPAQNTSRPAMPAYYQQQVYGSAEVDAISGKVLSLNRPVWYGAIAYADGSVGSGGMAVPVAAPAIAAR